MCSRFGVFLPQAQVWKVPFKPPLMTKPLIAGQTDHMGHSGHTGYIGQLGQKNHIGCKEHMDHTGHCLLTTTIAHWQMGTITNIISQKGYHSVAKFWILIIACTVLDINK